MGKNVSRETSELSDTYEKKERIQIVYVPIGNLKPAEYNPRKADEKQHANLKASIERFGLKDPIIVNSAKERKNVIIGGHFRLRVAKDLNIKEVPVVYVNIPDIEREKELNVRLNRNLGDWDMDLLADFDQDLLKDIGFDSKELDAIFSLKSEDKDDEVPEPPENPKSKRGDIYQLGRHFVMCGDITSVDDVFKLLDGNTANLLFTSPPYNAGDNSLGGNKSMKKQKYLNDSDNKNQKEYLSFISKVLMVYKQFSDYQFINIQQLSGNKIAMIEFLYAFRNNFVDTFIWHKGGGQPAMQESVLNSRFEYVHIFSKEENPTRQIKSNKFRNISNVFEFNPSGKNEFSGVHSATFPVAFADHCITLGTSRNGIVIDSFCGCGTSIISSEKLGRICYGMEIDPKYVDVIVKRWEDYTGKKAELINGKARPKAKSN